MIALIKKLAGIDSPEVIEKRRQQQEYWRDVRRQTDEAAQRYGALEEQLKDEPVNYGVLPDEIKRQMVALFVADGYRISIRQGGWRGINSDIYFWWYSGSTRTLFYERDYGTERFIRMVKAAHAYADMLMDKRDAALSALAKSAVDGAAE